MEAGTLQTVDCFSYRVDDRDRMYERMNVQNSHLWDVTEDATETVRDPTDIGQLQNRLDNALKHVDAHDHGIVVIDSLTELGSLVQPVRAYNFVTDIRADVCTGRSVPSSPGRPSPAMSRNSPTTWATRSAASWRGGPTRR